MIFTSRDVRARSSDNGSAVAARSFGSSPSPPASNSPVTSTGSPDSTARWLRLQESEKKTTSIAAS